MRLVDEVGFPSRTVPRAAFDEFRKREAYLRYPCDWEIYVELREAYLAFVEVLGPKALTFDDYYIGRMMAGFGGGRNTAVAR